MKYYLIFSALFFSITIAHAQPEPFHLLPQGCEIHCDSGIYQLTAPKGWILGDDKDVDYGGRADVFFCPRGKKWSSAETVMYVQAVIKRNGKTLNDIINDSINEIKANSNGILIKDADTIIIDKKKHTIAVVKYFSGGTPASYKAVGFINEKGFVVILIIASRTHKGLDENFPRFKELLSSYSRQAEKRE